MSHVVRDEGATTSEMRKDSSDPVLARERHGNNLAIAMHIRGLLHSYGARYRCACKSVLSIASILLTHNAHIANQEPTQCTRPADRFSMPRHAGNRSGAKGKVDPRRNERGDTRLKENWAEGRYHRQEDEASSSGDDSGQDGQEGAGTPLLMR